MIPEILLANLKSFLLFCIGFMSLRIFKMPLPNVIAMKNLLYLPFVVLLLGVFYFNWVPLPYQNGNLVIPNLTVTLSVLFMVGLLAPMLPNAFFGLLPFLRFISVVLFAAEFGQNIFQEKTFDLLHLLLSISFAVMGYVVGRIVVQKSNLRF